MVEEAIARKRMKFAEEEGEDRISALPDVLILEILSRLGSTESVIRTGILSKRWKCIWTSLPILIFSFNHSVDKRPHCDFVSFVNKTLAQCRQSKLRRFEVYTRDDTQFDSQVHNWIRYAISCKVQELDLSIFNFGSKALFRLNEEEFFINSYFAHLKLSYCMLNPNGEIDWKGLKSLYISGAHVDEGLIGNILSGSPRLEMLELESCYGYRRLDITSKSVKKIGATRISGSRASSCNRIEINAPYILSLVIQSDLKTNGKEEEMLKDYVQRLRHVKELKIGYFFSKAVDRLKDKGFIFPPNVKLPDSIYYDSDSLEQEDSSGSDSLEQDDWSGSDSLEQGDW